MSMFELIAMFLRVKLLFADNLLYLPAANAWSQIILVRQHLHDALDFGIFTSSLLVIYSTFFWIKVLR